MVNIGDVAPDFELVNQDGRPVRLSDFRGRPVVIFTFPKAQTLGCTAQACSFRDEFPQLETNGAVVLGISADPTDKLRAWKQQQNLPYDLLSDPNHTMLEQWGVWGASVLFVTLPVASRTVWVIDADGRVFDKQAPVGPKESVTRALDALRRMPQHASGD